MRRIAVPILALALAFGLASPANAIPYLINFSFPYLDPDNRGQTASGWFTFDSSILPSSTAFVVNSAGLGATEINFTLDGHTWTTENADLTMLGYWISDDLSHPDAYETINFSLNSLHDGYGQSGYSGYANAPHPGFELFGWHGDRYLDGREKVCGMEVHYTRPGEEWGYAGNGTFTISLLPVVAVPEPGTMCLFGLGLLPLGLIRRRKN